MKIEVLARYMVDDIRGKNVKYAVVSVTEPSANFCNYPSSDPNLMGLLALKFSDIVEPLDFIRDGEGRVIMRPIRPEQARMIIDFAKVIREEVDLLIVNCDAGVSRSAAIAAALLTINGEDDSHIWNSPYHHPNQLVYDLLLKEAGYNNES